MIILEKSQTAPYFTFYILILAEMREQLFKPVPGVHCSILSPPTRQRQQVPVLNF